MPGIFVPGNDPDMIYEVAGEAITRARAGGGPTLIELETHRLEGHFVGDTVGYRSSDELEQLAKLDPITLFRERLIADGYEASELDTLETEAVTLAEDAINFARSSEYTALEEAFAHVFGYYPRNLQDQYVGRSEEIRVGNERSRLYRYRG